jgi:hypothetical protein
LKQAFRSLISCAAVCAVAQAFAVPAHAQAVPRIKGTVVSFDGQVLTVQPAPDPAKSKSADATVDAPITAGILPETRYVSSQAGSFADLRANAYVGAVVAEGRNGRLKAQEVYLYDDALRGSGEGRFAEAGRLRVNGTLSEVKFTSPQDQSDGTMIVHYRGAVMNSAGRGKTVCEGRAAPPALMSALACAADAAIEVPPATPVSALKVGDPALLVPGATVTVALAKTPDGKQVTPGVIVEKPMTVEKKAIVEKPQSPQ